MTLDCGRDAHYWAPPAQIRTSPIRASGSYLGCLTAKRCLRLAVRGSAPGSRAPGSESGACFADPRFPWPLPLAPPPPPPAARLCSAASQLLWQSLTSPDRASAATAPHLPTADRRPNRALRPIRRPPGSRTRSVHACQVLRPRRVAQVLALALLDILPSTTQTASAPGISFLSRLNGWPARSPTDASPTSSRMPAHGSGPMWFATPSS